MSELTPDEISRIEKLADEIANEVFYHDGDDLKFYLENKLKAAAIHYQSKMKELAEQLTISEALRLSCSMDLSQAQSKIAELVEALEMVTEKFELGLKQYFGERFNVYNWPSLQKAKEIITNYNKSIDEPGGTSGKQSPQQWFQAVGNLSPLINSIKRNESNR